MPITLHATPEGPQPAAPQTPSQRLVAEANALKRVTDGRGRSLGYRRFNALERFRVTRALGRDASNDQLFLLAEVACSVREIDGNPVPFPTNMGQIEATIALVEEDGQTAVMQDWVREAQAQTEGAAAGGDMDYAKNSPGTGG